ncbi:hypothetical protein MYX07_05965 [Patescibacteria group bacterium AH-259-L07]|nr:hypothetical protein [Patescibacteria group bacterium AH-259-L07]
MSQETITKQFSLFTWLHPVKCCEAAISPLAKLFNRVKEIVSRLFAWLGNGAHIAYHN